MLKIAVVTRTKSQESQVQKECLRPTMPRFAKHDFTKYQPQPSSTDAGYSTDRPSWPSSNILNQYVANVFCSGVAMNIFSMASPKLERKQECKERKNGYKL